MEYGLEIRVSKRDHIREYYTNSTRDAEWSWN